jgi:antirestriction protein ArdC
LDLDLVDYEDAVLHEAARHAGAEAIVTRDLKGFARARLKLYAPDELLRFLAAAPQS